MDFISNLIKRPISLVRNDSLSTDQGQKNSCPNTPQHSPSPPKSPLLPFERAITPEAHRQRIVSAINDPLVVANIMDVRNEHNDLRAITTASTTHASPPIISQSPTQAFSHSPSANHESGRYNGNILNSPNTGGNTIEELLIQINDNLNTSDLLHTGTELNQPPLPNRPLSLSPIAFAKALSSEYNTISSKSAYLKDASSTQSKESSSSAPSSLKASVMAPVAENASATLIGSEKERCIEESKAGTFGVAVPPVSLKTDIHVDKDRNFTGVATDQSGTKIVEMPTSLNLNTEDRSKLTFEDGLIPTLTAAINEHEKNSNAAGKDESNVRHNLQVPMEPDTATSSDNETFAECETDQFLTSNNDYGFIADECSFENSEIESYFSAANSRNITITNEGSDPLSLTMNKLPEQIQVDQGEFQSLLSAMSSDVILAQQNVHSLDVTFDEEPMDVDVSCTEINEHLNFQLSQMSTSPEVAKKTISHENVATTIPHVECKSEISDKNETLNENTKTVQHETEIETTQSTVELQQNRSSELSATTAQSHNIEHNDIVSSTVENASKVTDDLTRDTIATTFPTAANSSLNPIEGSGFQNFSIEIKQVINKPLTGSHNALNLTTDMNSSTSSSKSSASSPSFPIKQKRSSVKQFPRSPTADALNKIPFLEKSEYTERIETERKKSVANDPKFVIPVSRKTSSVDEKPAQLAKFENVIASTVSCTVRSKEYLNGDVASTKANGSTITEEDVSSKDAKLCENLANRRTFNITPPATEEIENMSQKLNDEDKRRTYNIPSEQINVFSKKPDGEAKFSMPVAPTEADIVIQKNFIEEGSNRRTFNVVCSEENNDKLEEKSSSRSNVDERPITFTIPEAAPIATTSNNFSKPEEINEPMDLDETLPIGSKKPSQTPMQSPTTTVFNSPPIPTLQNRNTAPLDMSPSLPSCQNLQRDENITNLKMDDEAFKVPLPPSPASSTSSPPKPAIQKRPSIHAYKNTEDTVVEALSAKERTKRDSSDEKDVFAGTSTPSPMEDQPSSTSGFVIFDNALNVDADQQEYINEQFHCGNNLILNPSDFDYLFTKGNNSAPIDRNSILLKFDPLLGVPVPANQVQQQQKSAKQSSQILQNILGNNNIVNLSPTIEEDEHSTSSASVSSISNNQSCSNEADNKRSTVGVGTAREESFQPEHNLVKNLSEKQQSKEQQQQQPQQNPKTTIPKKHASMSVDVIKDMNIDNDCNKTFENSNSQPDEKQINYKMDELEKKIKNEVLKTEDIEKKLKEAEQREEALIKRITEKDKTIAKMTGVIEAYEKAIAELIAEKEQLLHSYEKQLAEVKADRDSNYQHLTSLETTFADLHVKYGKSKEMTLQLKSNEEALVAEKRQILENLRLQEQRYDKMKNHAMQQLEIANKKLESLNKEHSIETTKLKALLKKEEISRASIHEQLQQKSRENAELVKICDELISGQGS